MSDNRSCRTSLLPTALKPCRRCGLFKPLDEFRGAPGTRDRRSSWCMACALERTQQWRAEHRDEILAGRRATWARNREAINERRRLAYARAKP